MGRSAYPRLDAPDYQVQGKSATSYEYNVAKALETVDLPYMFQYQLFGGRARRGGIVLDFLVFTRPLSTPVFVNGGYWHSGQKRSEDELEQNLVFYYAKGEFQKPVIFWDEDCKTEEAALNAVRRELL